MRKWVTHDCFVGTLARIAQTSQTCLAEPGIVRVTGPILEDTHGLFSKLEDSVAYGLAPKCFSSYMGKSLRKQAASQTGVLLTCRQLVLTDSVALLRHLADFLKGLEVHAIRLSSCCQP